MVGYVIGSDGRPISKYCSACSHEKIALVIGILGALAELVNMLLYVKEVNLLLSTFNLFLFIGIVVAHFRKIPLLYLPFIVFNLLELIFDFLVLGYLLYAIVSRDYSIQQEACDFVTGILGSEFDFHKDNPYQHTVAWTIAMVFCILADSLAQWIVWKAFKSMSEKMGPGCLHFRLPTTSIGIGMSQVRNASEDERPLDLSEA